MSGVEMRYLANVTAGTLSVLLVFAIPFGIGIAARLSVLVVMVLLVLVAGCALFGWALWYLHHVRRVTANGARPALVKPDDARTMPVAVSTALLALMGYVLFGEVESARAGTSVDPGLWIAYGGTFIYSAVALARDVRSKLLGVPDRIAPFTARRLGEFEAALAQPTRNERRRAMAPLRSRGFARLAAMPWRPIPVSDMPF